MTEKMDSRVRGNDRGESAMAEELKLTIFTYKWGKRARPVGKGLPESLIK